MSSIVWKYHPPESLETSVPLPICARCGHRVESGEVAQSMTLNRYHLRVHCHGETEEVWIDAKELFGALGPIRLAPAFAKELPP